MKRLNPITWVAIMVLAWLAAYLLGFAVHSALALDRNQALWKTYSYGQRHCAPPSPPLSPYFCAGTSPSACSYLWLNTARRPQWQCWLRVEWGVAAFPLARERDRLTLLWDPYGRLLNVTRANL